MPRPRFEKLAKEKRERILEAAAKAFAAHGYNGASLNKILDEAGISKGAAYYYFDDKADLYTTTVLHYSRELLADSQIDLAQLTAETYWPGITAVYRHQFTNFYERPWVFGVVKSGGPLSPEALSDGPMAELWQQTQLMLARLIEKGQALGLVRQDLPDDLLMALVMAVDEAHDQWLFAHWPELTEQDVAAAAERISDILRRLLTA